MSLKLSFYGGAQEVTGACYLLEGESEGKVTRLLVDCGLFQGSQACEEKNHAPFAFDVKTLDAVVVTHSHIDHVGRIPKLSKEGFKGTIYSTAPTRELGRLMLEDSLGVLDKENGSARIFDEEDIAKAMSQWEAKEYHEVFEVGDFSIVFRESGHILGALMAEVEFKGKKIVFTGDLGNSPNPLLNDMEMLGNVDYLVMESAYGDRVHDTQQKAKMKLERVIEDTYHNKGVLMIPAFSLERTQEILFSINELIENGRVPRMPIFLDSPLAIKATRVYKQYERFYNMRAKAIIRSGDDLFNFPGLKITLTTDESKSINGVQSPKIIIAGSGMSVGGRIIHHEKLYLPDVKSILFLIGYQSAGSLGRQLMEGAKMVRIMGQDVLVEARVDVASGYSAHADMDDLFELVKNSADGLKKVFVVQGEMRVSSFFAQRVKDYLGVDAVVPKFGDVVELEA